MKKFIQENASYLGFISLLVITIVIFIVEALLSNQGITPREEVFLKLFELLFASATGWSLQKIQAQEDLQKNLKQYAISAYRRIADISKAVSRLGLALAQSTTANASISVIEQKILHQLLENIMDTVNSSASDWSDIIGDEIMKRERLEELVQRRNILESEQIALSLQAEKANNESIRKQIEDLTVEINSIKAELPPKMVSQNPTYEQRFSFGTVLTSLYNFFISRATSGEAGSYPFEIIVEKEITSDFLKRISEGKKYAFKINPQATRIQFFTDSELMGELRNPIAGYTFNDFSATFFAHLLHLGAQLDEKDENILYVNKVEVFRRDGDEPKSIRIKIPYIVTD